MREQSIAEQVKKLLGEEERWAEIKSAVTGLDTGFPSLNRITGGFQPGEVTVLAARTSHGKTSLGVGMAFSAAIAQMAGGTQRPVLIFSPEMTAAQLLHRYACQVSQVPAEVLRRGIANEDQRGRYRDAVSALSGMEGYLRLFAGQAMTATDIVDAIFESSEDSHTPALVVVDYIQRLKPEGGGNAYASSSQISTTLKDAANTYEIPLLVLSQLNRSVESDRNAASRNGEEGRLPTLSDIRDSGRIEEDADSVWLLWRPPHNQAHADDAPQKATLVVAKNRNGPVGNVSLLFYPRLTLFEDGGERRVRTDGGQEPW